MEIDIFSFYEVVLELILNWHFLGVQCPSCCSFNTTVDNIVMKGIEAAEFLGAVSVSANMDC